MLIRIVVQAEAPLIVPYSYSLYLQAFLYHFINEERYAQFLHDTGYSFYKRVYKLFCFSNFIEAPRRIDQTKRILTFPETASFYVSSVEDRFFQFCAESMLEGKGPYQIGRQTVQVTQIESLRQVIGDRERVRALSPITVYSTMTAGDGRKRTVYYAPQDAEFGRLVRQNLIHKYQAYYGDVPGDDRFSIVPLSGVKERRSLYKNFVIRGFLGQFLIEGSRELMEMAFAAGLGGKNGQGFGMILQA